MKAPFLYLFLALSICLSACKQNTEVGLKPANSRSVLAPNTGNISELVIVIPDALWNGVAGTELKNIFQTNVLGIPQQEALFDVFAINPSQFSSIFQTHKNILWLSIGTTASVSRTDEKWAKNQLFVSVKANSETELSALLVAQGEKISDWFLRKDLARRVLKLKKTAEKEVQKELLDAYNFQMLIPNGYKVAHAEEDFVWLRRDKPKVNVISNLWVLTIPYTNPAQLSKEYLIQVRDSLGRTHVEGSRPQSYMTTEMLYEPDFTLLSQNPYTVEMRGLWTMVNDFLGGSFISYTRLDKASQRIIYTEGFLYCPKERKRFHMQELEAVMSSFKMK